MYSSSFFALNIRALVIKNVWKRSASSESTRESEGKTNEPIEIEGERTLPLLRSANNWSTHILECTSTRHIIQIVYSPLWIETRHQSNRGQLSQLNATLNFSFEFSFNFLEITMPISQVHDCGILWRKWVFFRNFIWR